MNIALVYYVITYVASLHAVSLVVTPVAIVCVPCFGAEVDLVM